MHKDKPHYSFIKFPEGIDEQKEYIYRKACERCNNSICMNPINKLVQPCHSFKELVEIVDEVIAETEYHNMEAKAWKN